MFWFVYFCSCRTLDLYGVQFIVVETVGLLTKDNTQSGTGNNISHSKKARDTYRCGSTRMFATYSRMRRICIRPAARSVNSE